MKQFLMGNEAIAWGALHAGVRVVCGYPGTPSTEILETIAKYRSESVYVEWSVNEKAALEVAAGASYAGARTLVTMKQVGLNVASDPLMSLSYVGIEGGMVIVAADDPGPISSQTEQDTRRFAEFAKLLVYDPSSPEEAYAMMAEAYAMSEEYRMPVLLRPTTRVCHGCSVVELKDEYPQDVSPKGFRKDPKWTIFPQLSYKNHVEIEKRNALLSEELSSSPANFMNGQGRIGIACGGISYSYTREVLASTALREPIRLLKVGTPHPFPEELAARFLDGLDTVLVAEELDPVIEKNLLLICGKQGISVRILGKLSGDLPFAGEYSSALLRAAILRLEGLEPEAPSALDATSPDLPVRPPVLCAGCPHRASFYAVKTAMKGRSAVYSGDIGCYTLGNAKPLDMTDTCLCMGAGVTIAQGLGRVEPDVRHFAFIGDSTFFASGITGAENAVYNHADLVLVILDNSTTAMTGHQPHPGTGQTMMGETDRKVDIRSVLSGIGVSRILEADPLDLPRAVAAAREASEYRGVSAVIFKSPCIAVSRPEDPSVVDVSSCTGCRKCIHELGCPAIRFSDGRALIEPSICFGCRICESICPTKAIRKGARV